MIRKSLGAVCVLVAASLLLTSAASAANFTAASYPVKVTGTQTENIKITIGTGTITCTSITHSGELIAQSETLTLSPVYSGCTMFGFVGGTITGFSSTGCFWRYRSTGLVDLACNKGSDVQFDAGTCTVTLEPGFNQGRKTVTYTNNVPSAGTFTADINVINMHAVVTSGFGCPVAGGTYSSASMTGRLALEGKNSKGGAVTLDVQ
jgi:hypothetical protein